MIAPPKNKRTYRWQSSGFIQARVAEETRLHLWAKKFDTTRKERSIHDHSFYFRSTVILGELNWIEYKIEMDYDGDFNVWRGDWDCLGPCRLITVGEYTVKTGETYEFGGPGRYHDTIKGEDTMTHLVVTDKEQGYFNQFVLPLDKRPDHLKAKKLGPSEADMRNEVVRVYNTIKESSKWLDN